MGIHETTKYTACGAVFNDNTATKSTSVPPRDVNISAIKNKGKVTRWHHGVAILNKTIAINLPICPWPINTLTNFQQTLTETSQRGIAAIINGGITAAIFFNIICNGKWISKSLSYEVTVSNPNSVIIDNKNNPSVKTARKPDVIFEGGNSKIKI